MSFRRSGSLIGSPPEEGAGQARTPAVSTGLESAGLLLDELPAVVWAVDRDLRFTFSGGGGLAALGTAPGEVVGTTLFEYFGTTDVAFAPIAAHRAALAGASPTYDLEWSGRAFQARLHPLRAVSGEVVGVVGIALDVTERARAEAEAAEAEARYRSLVEHVPVVVYLAEFGPGGGWAYVSPRIEDLLGYPAQTWMAEPEPFARWLHPEDRARVLAEERRCRASREPFTCEYRLLAEDGEEVWVRDVAVVVAADEHGGLWQGVLSDITEAKRAEQELAARERRLVDLHAIDLAILSAGSLPEVAGIALSRLRGLVACERACLVLLDADLDHARVVAVDQAGDLGPEAGEVLEAGEAFPEDRTTAEQVVVVSDLQTTEVLWPLLRRLHAPGIRSVLAAPLVVDGRPVGVLTLAWTVPEGFAVEHADVVGEVASQLGIAIRHAGMVQELRARADELAERVDSLRAVDAARRELFVRLVRAEEHERRRLAAELHDDPVQVMTVVGMRLHTLAGRLDDPEASGELGELGATVQDAIQRMRWLMFDLRPPSLEQAGVAAALRDHLDHTGPEFAWQVEDRLEVALPAEVAGSLYRVALEALANIVKHASASEVRVELAQDDGGVRLVVRDDGVGFDPEAIGDVGPQHLGVASMRERAELAGGRWRIASAPGRGTTVECWLPLGEWTGAGPAE